MGKQQEFWASVEDQTHKVTLVHSKHHGWLAVGLTVFAMGAAGTGLLGQSHVVHASDQQPSQSNSQANNGRVWKLRPVSQIEAQLKASDKTVYDIQWGDTLSTISEAMNNSGLTTSVERLAAINHIANVDLIYAGAKLTLQGSGANATVTTQNAAGTNQTFNLNPAKPAVASPAQQAETKYTVVGGSNGSAPSGYTNLSGSGQSGQNITSSGSSANGSSANGRTPTDDAAAKKALEAAAAAKAKAEAEKAAAEKAKAEAEAKLIVLLNKENEQTLTQLQSKRTAAQTAVDTAKAKVTATQSELQEAQAVAKQAQTAFDQANAAVNAKQIEVDQATSAVKDLTGQITSLQAQLDTMAGQVKNDPTSQAQVVDVKAKLAVAQEKITVYEGQLADANSALSQAKQAAGLANQKLGTANQNLTAVDNEAKAAQSEFDQAQTTLQSLPETVTSSNSQEAATVKQHLADLNAKLDQLNQTIANLNTQIAAWQDQLSLAKTNTDAANADIKTANEHTEKVDATDHNGTLTTVQQTVAEAKKTLPTIHIPHNTEKNVTINQDENGQVLTNLDGYKLIKAGTPVKSVQTLANGDTVTTYTTTNIYHKIAYRTVNKTVNVDESGNILTNVDGYTRVSISREVAADTDPTTGDVTTTNTTTIVWKKNETPHFIHNVMVNVDETGKVLTNTDNYEFVNVSARDSETTDPKTGQVTTTYTITTVWQKNTTPGMTITNSTVNKDDEGHVLASTDGYRFIKFSTSSTTLTIGNWTREMAAVTYVFQKA
ncbi:hypothetical protein BVJ53_13390 [Lacticaseibacillus chiayiensis]|uniref:LysM domain-containing protein n=1 Tax=Lacticaseibacillus chiayiensis TaxID=2100821 RepID=A0A4Q1TK81_9LACO|nr:LysM peptidoglycan-binding domain-containing protein [Lacticaseibacillus chiayiensis]RXT18491.1 hypothetical protein BVJ53_13390 [Lacticaseibacillus chiayiensis]